MRPWFLILLVIVMTASALFTNWYVRESRVSISETAVETMIEPELTSASVKESAKDQGRGGITNLPLSPEAKTPFEWSAVETTDYKQYVLNLRAVGFPEELIRAIVVADIEKLYAPREEPLRRKPVAFDASMRERQEGHYSSAEWERVFELRRVQMEKQAVIKEILGIYVPREFLRGPWSRNYSAYEYALTLVPPEKRNAAQLIMEEEIITEAKNREILNRSDELEAFRRSWEKRDSALREILTAEEFGRFEMHATSAGTQLARNTVGMEPTEEEFAAMFKVTYQYWLETGGIFSRYRAIPVPPERIAEAQEKLHANLKELLGPDRYLDYQMATTETGRQLRNLAARYELRRETLVQAVPLLTEADQLAKNLSDAKRRGNSIDPALPARLVELEQQVQQVLGPGAGNAWNDRRNDQVALDPNWPISRGP